MDLLTYTSQPGRSAASLAKALRVPAVTVTHWRLKQRPVPLKRCPDIEWETAGAVACEALRPDVAWVRVKDRRWPNSQGRPLVDFASSR